MVARTGTAVVKKEARGGRNEVVTEEEVRVGADDNCTEQDEKVMVKADENEARYGRISS